MRGSATALLVVLLLWLAGSAWWYTCKIKDNCISFSRSSSSVQSTLVVELDGYDPATFYLKNSTSGVMEFMPGSNTAGLSVIKDFLRQNPERSIDLITANESQANGLLAMLILSGVPNRRINAYTDPSLGSDQKPLKIMSSAEDIPEKVEEGIADTTAGTEDISEESAVEYQPAQPGPVRRLPCPTVDTEGGLPMITDILYPSAGYAVRCTDQLSFFAKAANPWLKDDTNVSLIITGHTDNNQNLTNNYQLALKRAVEVKKYLIKKGIPGHRIETYSKGADAPVADNGSEDGKQSNRRVAITWNY